MSVYSYHGNSLINYITFDNNDKGGVIAFLRADKNATPATLANISKKLREKDWFCTPCEQYGQHVLEVRKFGKEESLINTLKELHAVKGDPHIDKSSIIPQNPIEYIKQRSLQASGVMQAIGDVCFFVYGVKGNSLGDTIAGLLYNAGTLELLTYGRNDQSNREVQEISHQLNDYLEAYSIQAPISCSLKGITEDSKKGLVHNTKELLERYPSEIYNIFTGMAGLGVASSARKKMTHEVPKITDAFKAKETMKSAKWDMGLGLATFSATTFGLAVKEKKHDPDAPPPNSILGKAWQWAQEKPLKVTGGGLMFSTVCHAISTMTEYKEARRTNDKAMLSTIPWRGGFVAANLVAELLLIISSKGHGDGVLTDASVKESIFSSAAELINAQPEEKRDEAYKHIANFLGKPEIFAESAQAVETQLKHHMQLQKTNPWACNNIQGEKSPDTVVSEHHVQHSQSISNQGKSPTETGWQQALQPKPPSTDPHLHQGI